MNNKEDLEIYDAISEDDLWVKRALPLCVNVWQEMRMLGWEKFYALYDQFIDIIIDELAARAEEAVAVTKKIADKEITRKQADQILTYWVLPPVLVSKTSLIRDTSRIVYGNSADITFCGLSDYDREIKMAINFHFEEGFPTKHWFVKTGDPILEKRHMKLGYMLKNIPKYFPTLAEAGANILPVLRDIRNEKYPEHYNASYNTCLFALSGGVSNGMSPSNWHAFAHMWENIHCGNNVNNQNPKMWEKVGSGQFWNDALELYEPWPPIFLQLIKLSRKMWCERICGLLSNYQLFFHYILNIEKIDALGMPIKRYFKDKWEEGMPLPAAILQRTCPDLTGPREKWRFGNSYPEDLPRLTLDDLGITFEEACTGVLTNITHQTKETEFSFSNVVAIGHGLDTKFIENPKK